MKIKLLCLGKNTSSFVEQGVEEYQKRIKKYIHFEIVYLKNIKSNKQSSPLYFKKEEGNLIMKHISQEDHIVLLDENGMLKTSKGFSGFVEQKMIQSTKNLTFIIGGAYGFSDEIYKRAQTKLSLSKMTFPHQLIRVLFLEQLYRVFTILNNEPYHNE